MMVKEGHWLWDSRIMRVLIVLLLITGFVNHFVGQLYIGELKANLRTLQAVCIDGGGR